jgi:hypothetical protein
MPIIARKKQSNYKPAPEGLHQAVCCDVWEPWDAPNPFQEGEMQTKTAIVWQLDSVNPETGKPYEVMQQYTLTLHEKSNLCKVLESWRGRAFTDAEKDGFDIEALIGANCQIQIIHNIKDDGRVFANVQAVVPLGKNTPKIRVSEGFVRKRDRQPANHHNGDTVATVPEGTEVPF